MVNIQNPTVQWISEYQTLMFQRSENSKMVQLLDQCSNDYSNSQHLVTGLGLVYYSNVYYFVVCCCKLNNNESVMSIYSDKLALSQVNYRNSVAQLCTWLDTPACLFTHAVLDDVMSQNELTTIGTTFINLS